MVRQYVKLVRIYLHILLIIIQHILLIIFMSRIRNPKMLLLYILPRIRNPREYIWTASNFPIVIPMHRIQQAFVIYKSARNRTHGSNMRAGRTDIYQKQSNKRWTVCTVICPRGPTAKCTVNHAVQMTHIRNAERLECEFHDLLVKFCALPPNRVVGSFPFWNTPKQ